MVISEEDLGPELSERASRSGCIAVLFCAVVKAEEENAGLRGFAPGPAVGSQAGKREVRLQSSCSALANPGLACPQPGDGPAGRSPALLVRGC